MKIYHRDGTIEERPLDIETLNASVRAGKRVFGRVDIDDYQDLSRESDSHHIHCGVAPIRKDWRKPDDK